ncbi:MAG TPA: BMC domain-containing protein [Polyangiaceae bacterium]|jgi:ethanolamine utilization microcompartment shell protein EutL|nr:MAG: BMC domain protein [Deltaproteobacteria bacterium ADurb.Bin207]HNS99782.1 BMC domain-containing protein [Polyangiaceae bacterium]HNZ23796.1 BMC domain-containing protein [Polyangiaceae bacterium]HOD24575.1 BMC domain-containing protein [Polyangiaceae bacterium]HOE50150.1 BMC domain-containing protein [Polyangiaceae bacterium]
MASDKSAFQLRAYVFIDSLQPQLAQFMAKTNRVYDPREYDAALFLEIAPAMEIHTKIDQALKSTRVRLGSLVTERVFGMMQVHHSDQGEVRAAGEAVLTASGLSESDRAPCEILQNKVIRSIEQDHAIAFTGMSAGNMALQGESVLIMEAQPAAYLSIACNEALKAARVKLIDIRVFGATGRLILSGPEAEIDVAAQAASKALDHINTHH